MSGCVITLLVWGGIAIWSSTQTTAREWTRALAHRFDVEFSSLTNAAKARSLRLIVSPDEALEAGEALIEVSPAGRITLLRGSTDDAAPVLDALAAETRRFRQQDFYVLGGRLFMVVPESFLEAAGKRRVLYVHALTHDFVKRLRESNEVEILLVDQAHVLASSLENLDGKRVLPRLPAPLVLPAGDDSSHLGKTLLDVGRYGGLKVESQVLLRGARYLSVFYSTIPIRSVAHGVVATAVVMLPEESVMHGSRQLLYELAGLCLLSILVAVRLCLKGIERVAGPIRILTEKIHQLGGRISEGLAEVEGSPQQARASSAPLASGQRIAELAILNRTFASLVSEIGRSEHYQHLVEETQKALKRSNQELEEFAYTVAHDLRAPLRSIDGFSLIIAEDYGDKIGDAGKAALERVRAASTRMAQLIDDILNLSRLSRIEIERVPVDLSAIARTFAAELRARDPERQVELVIAEGIVVQAAQQLLRAVIENLLGNAWKFTARHPRARIEFGVTEVQGQRAYFVRDDGAGFDMAHVDKLFGVFQRLHGMNEFAGTGVGLASVQRIIRRHGGKVWAEGELEKGATIYFTLP